MRAKLQVGFVQQHFSDAERTKVSSETVTMHAVAATKYEGDGADEDNTYARWSPSAQLTINIANPVLFGKFKAGDKFYVDFTPATA
ncbi:MAG: hypothetical protein KA784_00140 [Aquabacterium sp.]|nr:hypothetical protein [Aquabacterium sp.]